MKAIYHMGLDVGSTTVKLVIINNSGKIIYNKYERHFSDIKKAVISLIKSAYENFHNESITFMITGSGGISIAKRLGISFIQEVIASSKVIRRYYSHVNVAIELGGEDAKITYFDECIDQKMNGTCAGGTGAFIDQMAALLNTDAAGLNELAKNYRNIYPIASRCGVFAKTDIQPLLNEGTSKEDIAVSILQAVVNQTIGGLASGKPIRGNVAFLGGPLYFLSELRKRFIETLALQEEQIIFPENSQLFVAIGAALASQERPPIKFEELVTNLRFLDILTIDEPDKLEPLFISKEEFYEFAHRHQKQKIKRKELNNYAENCFLGIDVGSTTTKLALIADDGSLLYSYYGRNEGSPLKTTIKALKNLYDLLPSKAKIANSAVTGYGERLLKSALSIDIGEVETVAHYKSAAFFLKDVDFILDIGGQDMKCLKIKNGVNVVVLPSIDNNAVEEGLKYVNNDACYPSIIVIGQIIEALNSGKYNLDNTSVMISQTAGGCRATNYIGILRKALKDAGYSNIPVISLSAAALEKNPGFTITPGLINKTMIALIYGDLLMRVLLKVRPYEKIKGSANQLYKYWVEKCKKSVITGKHNLFVKNIKNIIKDFDNLEIQDIIKPRIGLVGEVLVKFHPTANNNVVDIIEKEGAEVVIPDFIDFLAYCAFDANFKYEYLSGSKTEQLLGNAAILIMEYYRKEMKKALKNSKRFEAPKNIRKIADMTSNVVSLGNQTGEGWFLTGEMIEFIQSGVNDIICMQPFACLPNHITGKGMIKELKYRYPGANITAIDYDPGASQVNQLNRIKLMLSVAFDKVNNNQLQIENKDTKANNCKFLNNQKLSYNRS